MSKGGLEDEPARLEDGVSAWPSTTCRAPRPPKATSPGDFSPGLACGLLRYFFSIFLRSISFLSASRFSTLNSTRRFFDMLSTDVLGTSGRLAP